MSECSPAPQGSRPDFQRRPARPGWIVMSTVLGLVLSLNLVLPGGLRAVASVLPSNGSPTVTRTQATTEDPTAPTGALSRADIAEAASPAVVTVFIEQANGGFGGFNQNQDDDAGAGQIVGAGSGFIVDEEGHVVTNNHVVADGDAFLVEFFDGTQVSATLVGRDPLQDVAVLQLDLEDGLSVPGTLAWGDSNGLRAGDDVITIGTPLGEFTNSVSAGIVAGVDRSLSDSDGALDNLIQHDAPISSGNSGGPLLNMAGEVVGINTASATGGQLGSATTDGLGFAVAGNTARAIVDQLIESGSIVRPYLGITGQPLENGHGVVSVEDNSPAVDAGLQEGDVITAIDGTTIDARTTLQDVLYSRQPGDQVTLTVDRDGEEVTLTVTLGERPDDL